MMPSDLKITGIEQALVSFTEIARQTPRKVARKVLLKASTPVLRSARDNLAAATNTKSGNLMESLKTGQGRKYRKGRADGTGYVVIGPAWPKGAHGHLVEYGHRIVIGKRHGRASNADRIAQAALGGQDMEALASDPAVQGRAVNGFVPPRPFMRPAIDSTRNEVAAAIYRGLLEHFEAEVAKHVRGSTAAASSAI